MNKRNNLVDCVESIERYDELKMEVIEEAQKVGNHHPYMHDSDHYNRHR